MSADLSPLADYASTGVEEIARGCEDAMRRAETVVAEIGAIPAGRHTFVNTLLALDGIDNLLTEASGRYGFLSQVAPDSATRGAAHTWEERLDTFATSLGFREELYRAVQAFAGTSEAQALDPVSVRLLEHTLRDFRRNGMELEPPQRAHVQDGMERLVGLGIQFRRNIDDFEDVLLLTRDQLVGLPDGYINGLHTETVDGQTRYRVSLDYPELFPFLEAAEDRALREELFRKNHNKAAAANVPVLHEAIALRDEIATTLGYGSWADYVLETRMAKSPQAVHTFLMDLERRVAVKARRDLALLQDLRVSSGDGTDPVAIWDWRYYTQRLLQERHHVDPFVVAEYFPLDAVLDGLFSVYQELVGVRFLPGDRAPVWHPDVRAFDIVDADEERLVGHVYLDLYPRPGKFGHAAAFTLRGGRALSDGGYQRPVSALAANFTKPRSETPSLLRHSEVVTLFHEFGHILHQTLTRSRFVRFSGTRVQRDFVEAPSQMLEHWCWEPAVLARMTRHHRSGDPLPADLSARMVAAKHLSSGIATLRQIYFARLDLAAHGPGAHKDTDALARDLHPITGFPFPEGTHFQAGFGHLFGYDAGYYGYLWSRVFGDDMYTRFEGSDAGSAGVGREYRRRILEPGGIADGDALVRGFLGRDPTQDAFLRDLGLDG